MKNLYTLTILILWYLVYLKWKFTSFVAGFEHVTLCLYICSESHITTRLCAALQSLLEMNVSLSIYKDVDMNFMTKMWIYIILLLFSFSLCFLYLIIFSLISLHFEFINYYKYDWWDIPTLHYSFLGLGKSFREIWEKMIKWIHSFIHSFIHSKYKKKIYFNYNYNIISIWTIHFYKKKCFRHY